MGIDDLRRQLEEKLNSGELGGGSGYAKINFRSNGGTAHLLARANAAPQRRQKPKPPPDLVELTKAAGTWANSSTNQGLDRAPDVVRDKLRTVRQFLIFLDKDLPEVTPPDVDAWTTWLRDDRALAATTVYTYATHLADFFDWIIAQPEFKPFFRSNPVRAAFPKFQKPYQSTQTKSLTDEALKLLWDEMRRVQGEGGVVALRDYAMFLFFAATGDRRAEIANLRGADIEILPSGLTYRPRVKGGTRKTKTVPGASVAQALLDYVRASGRRPEKVFGRDVPVWLSHDFAVPIRKAKKEKMEAESAAGNKLALALELSAPKRKSQKGLTSHAFAARMKKYAARVGIYDFHLHQIRHTFARIVNEETGSLAMTQEALGHKSMETTRIYVPNIRISQNAHSSRLEQRMRRVA